MIDWLIQALAASTLLMLLVEGLRRCISGRVKPTWIYALWLLPALRLVTPPLPLWKSAPVLVDTLPETESGFDITSLLITIWLLGAALSLVWHLGRYIRFVRAARADSLGSMTIGVIRVWRSGAVDGPAAAGLWRREIFLPLDFVKRFDTQERRLAVAHELMHHRRQDVLANLIALSVLALHWFNPIAYRAHRLFRADQELSCDADVMAQAGQGRRATYGQVLFKASVPAGPCSNLSEAALLKMRLSALTTATPSSPQRGAVPIAVFSMLAIIALSATTGARNESTIPPLASESPQKPVLAFALAPPPLAVHPRLQTPLVRTVAKQPSMSSTWHPMTFLPSRHTDPDYLRQRRELGLARSRTSFASPAEAAAARGHPLIDPLTSS